jgi:hypothetical protein
MANVFSSNPIYIDTDTTYAATTNWKGALGGSSYTGGLGIRPFMITTFVTATGTGSTLGNIVINMINSTGGGTGPVLFKCTIPTLTTTAQSYNFHLDGDGADWKDFIVTGCTATGTGILIYYRV